MSINIGYLGDNYGTNNINSLDNNLVVNTYNTSNSININTNTNSTSNALINYKNVFKTGIINNNYVIQNSSNNNMILLNNSNININNKILFNTDFSCKTILNTCNDIFNMTSNINIHLYKNNNFNCYDNETNNFNFTFNNSGFTSYKNSYFNQNLYVNDIRPNSISGGLINIYNANLIGAKIESTDVVRFSINGIKTVPFTGQSFIINRYYNSYNILEFNTLNYNTNVSSNNYYNEPIFKHFMLDNNGMVGIGSKQPDAPLSISANYTDNPYVFKYTGTELSDTFNITKEANVGIGTTNPSAILHINRNDDKFDIISSNLSYEKVRKLPLLKLNIDYDITKNNINNSNTDIIINSSNILAINKYNYQFIPINTNINIFNNTSQLTNNIYLLNSNLNILINNNSNITYKTYILNNYLKENNFSDTNANIAFNYKNNIYYPENLFLLDYLFDYNYNLTTSFNFIIPNSYAYKNINNYNHSIIILSKDSYNLGKYNSSTYFRTNINNFNKITSNFYVSTLVLEKLNFNGSNIFYYQDVNFNLNMYIEKNKDFKISYNTSNILIQSPAPDFLYLTSNNDFKAAISHDGLLSLGTKYSLNDNKYLLYIPDKTAYINNMEINSITTNNSSIIFNNKDLSNINNISSTSANILNSTLTNINSCNIYTSNIIIYDNLTIKNIKMNSSNVHLTNKLSISSDPLNSNNILTDNSSLMKITVNSNVLVDNSYFKNNAGFIITNNNVLPILSSNINPSINIYGKEGSYPLIKLSKDKIRESGPLYTIENTLNNYFIRLATKQYSIGGTSYLEHFEICCDNIQDSTNKINYYNNINDSRRQTNILPSFIKHIKNYNLMCFGELNNICIKCDNKFSDIYDTILGVTVPSIDTFTNSTNKISLGIPFKDTSILVNNLQSTIEDWSQLFNNNICSLPIDISYLPAYNKYNNNMLNIFGNTGIWSISGNNILNAKMNVNELYNDIGCDITLGTDNNIFNANTNLNVYGSITSVLPIKTYSTSNLMTDIRTFDTENPVEKIKNITGISYRRIDTGLREIGLKAEEIQQHFPTLVNSHNDKLTIQYGNMAAIFVEAIKELSGKINVLSNNITTINSNITTINSRLDSLETA